MSSLALFLSCSMSTLEEWYLQIKDNTPRWTYVDQTTQHKAKDNFFGKNFRLDVVSSC